jgi:hypothetical protein
MRAGLVRLLLPGLRLMTEPYIVALLTVVGCVVAYLLIGVAAAGGDFKRFGLAWRAYWRALRDPDFAARVEPLLAPRPAGPPKPSGEPLRLLALLQREGRLVDFLMEDLQAADPGQIVAGMRDIHPKWQKALQEHLVLEPVIAQPEGSTVEVPPGFDPAAVRLVGNVTGQPPFRGTLIHPGWRVKEIKLAPPPEGQDEFVVQPAEVELP